MLYIVFPYLMFLFVSCKLKFAAASHWSKRHDSMPQRLTRNIRLYIDFLEELGLHTNFGILIRDKGNEKRMVDAIAKKK